MPTKIDVKSENFDLYFFRQVSNIPKEKRELVDKELSVILWKNDGSVSKASMSRLNIFHRLYILSVVADKEFTITIGDSNGVSLEQWSELMKKKDYSLNTAEELSTTGSFILGSKEVVETLNYLNHLCRSPAYNYALKLKGKIPNQSVEYNKQMRYIAKMFKSWEAHKKSWQNEFSVNLPELYVLITLYVEGEMVGSKIYLDIFKRTYQAGPGKIKRAFGTLQAKRMIERMGIKRGASLRITAVGVEVLHRILRKYALNC